MRNRLSRPSGILLLVFMVGLSRAHGQTPSPPLLGNGSFELGDSAPLAWQSTGAGDWATGTAHRGKRFLRANSAAGEVVWRSDSLSLEPEVDYRLEGWMRSPTGEARLGIDLVDANGTVTRSIEVPPSGGLVEWRYVAVEFRTDKPLAKVWFAAKGSADLDDVGLTPVAISYLGNRDVQSDAKGRVGLWNEEKDGSVAPGSRGGAHRGDPEVKRRDLPSLLVESTGAWYAIASVNYGVPAFTDKIELSGWARCEGPARAQILACWSDDTQKLLRVDASAEMNGADWGHIKLSPVAPPEHSHTVRLVALARGGRVWFDQFDLLEMRSSKPVIRSFVNQVGYELGGAKSAIVATNFFPSDRSTLNFQVADEAGKVVLEKEVPCSGRIYGGQPDDWGWYFWRADFSELRQPGTYRIAGVDNEARGESFPFVVGRSAVLERTAQSAVDFFFIQRCGFEVPGWHKACHLDDAKLPDGTHVDVSGGWHSAGDYNKPMWQFGDSGVSYALATAYTAQPAVFGRFDRDKSGFVDALDEAWWGAKFLSKMQNPADGSMLADVLQGPARTWMKWSAPDEHTDNKIGTADDPVIAAGTGNVPLTIAAWASLARVLNERGVRNDYTDRAERLWNFLAASESAAANPLLLVGALELFRTTNQVKYRQFAQRSAESLLKQQKPTGAMPGDTGDHGDVAAAALSLLALQFKDDPLQRAIAEAMRRYLDFCIARTDNPFGLTRQGVEEPEGTFFHPSVGLGVNFWILSRAWAALLVHQLNHDPRALAYATDQIDWVLGKNPFDLCMFEGHGGLNPPRYHHRYNMIPDKERGAVPGAIANGMVRDMGIADRPGFDMSRGGNRSPSFRTSEPWLVHNMFYLLAVSALDKSVNERQASP
ncbi:MAG: glycoside hydrolase family 9 protein [Planctomycetia bacterium]|nr:glycoside hydrolase family 9 protein [Planctomycetia bacterium]